MDIYLLDNDYARREVIDAYESVIWTERFKGDGDFELHIPVEDPILSVLYTGTLLECEGSEQPMIIEEIDTESNVAKFTGMTITQWLNNRFLRDSPTYTDKTWTVEDVPIGQLICTIVQDWCVDSPYLSAGVMGFDANYLKIPGLFVVAAPANNGLAAFDHITGDIEYGPVYDLIRLYADQGGVGLKIFLNRVDEVQRNIGFKVCPVVNKAYVNSSGKIPFFSPVTESLGSIKELQSESDHWNEVYMFLSEVSDLSTQPDYNYGGYVRADWTNRWQNGQTRFNRTTWDKRVRMTFSDISQEDYDAMPIWDGITPAIRPDTRVDKELYDALAEHHFVHLIDGEIVSSDELQYGVDFDLGNIVAMQGYSKDIIGGQVTEFIRSKDSSGERAFPTVETYPGVAVVWSSELE